MERRSSEGLGIDVLIRDHDLAPSVQRGFFPLGNKGPADLNRFVEDRNLGRRGPRRKCRESCVLGNRRWMERSD